MKVKEQLQKLLEAFMKMLDINKQTNFQMKEKLKDFLINFDQKIKRLTEEESEQNVSSPPQEVKGYQTLEVKCCSTHSQGEAEQQQQSFLDDKKLKPEFNIKLDFFVIELDNLTKKYNIIGIRQNNFYNSIKQVVDLFTSEGSVHIRNIGNQKQFIQKSANFPKILKPLVIPLSQNGCQYWNSGKAYEESDRFFMFICQQFLPYTYIQIAKTVVRMDYNNRLEIRANNYEYGYSAADLISKKSLFTNLNLYIDSAGTYHFSKTKNLKNQKSNQLKWYLRHVHNYKLLVSFNHMQFVSINLFSFVLYYCLKDYKIIMIGTKQTRHMMSEVVIAIKTSLFPILYNHPTIFASISQNHNNYIDAPVPLILCLWGEQNKCTELINLQKQTFESESPYYLPTIVINLNKKTAIGKTLDPKESRSLASVDKAIAIVDSDSQIIESGKLKRKLTASIVEKAKEFVFQVLIPGKSDQNKELQSKFKETSIYKNFEIKMK